MGILYPLGRLLSRIHWHNYIIPYYFWKLMLGKNFMGTYMGIPIYKTDNLIDVEGGIKLDRPTDEQIKELWEWCGLVKLKAMDGYKLPNGELIYGTIDLNSLFKYAIPKLLGEYYIDIKDYKLGWSVSIRDKLGNRYSCDGKDPALALFWAIYQVIKAE